VGSSIIQARATERFYVQPDRERYAEIFDHDPKNGRLVLTEPVAEANHLATAAQP